MEFVLWKELRISLSVQRLRPVTSPANRPLEVSQLNRNCFCSSHNNLQTCLQMCGTETLLVKKIKKIKIKVCTMDKSLV